MGCAAGGLVAAATPAEIEGLRFDDATTVAWTAEGDGDVYHVYRGPLAGAAPDSVESVFPGYGAAGLGAQELGLIV